MTPPSAAGTALTSPSTLASQSGLSPLASPSPLRAVLAELEAGAPTLDEVARRTGLDRDVVGAAVDHLVRLGRVSSSTLSTSCPDDGCGACPAGNGCDAQGAPAPSGRRPVLVALSVRRRPGV
jgi:hypothetical protein